MKTTVFTRNFVPEEAVLQEVLFLASHIVLFCHGQIFLSQIKPVVQNASTTPVVK
jgi:hypothetical protein